MSAKKRLRPAPKRKPAPTPNRKTTAALRAVTVRPPSAPETVVESVPEASAAGAIAALERALGAVREFAARRLEERLSTARLNGVVRELRELVKLMSVYES